jgi:hypothetical protein
VTTNSYAVISRCVEEGVRAGLRRANKHREEANAVPSDEAAVQTVQDEVMRAICEMFRFPTPPE